MVQQINNKGRKKVSQQEEMKNLTLLGSKETPYIFGILSTSFRNLFDNRHADNDYFIKLTVQNLRHFVLLLGNQISLASISLIFQTSFVWSLNL